MIACQTQKLEVVAWSLVGYNISSLKPNLATLRPCDTIQQLLTLSLLTEKEEGAGGACPTSTYHCPYPYPRPYPHLYPEPYSQAVCRAAGHLLLRSHESLPYTPPGEGQAERNA